MVRRTKHSAFSVKATTQALNFEANSIASLASISPIFPESARLRRKSS